MKGIGRKLSGKKLFVHGFSNIVIILTLTMLVLFSFNTGSVFAGLAENEQPYYKGNSKNNEISLMINVYWGTEFVQPMMDIFNQYGFKTTFFVGGSWVEDNNDLLREMYNRGFEIGNHGYFHKDHKNLSKEKNLEEIAMTGKIVKAVTGYDMDLFAPPSGSIGANMFAACKELGYKTIMWSKDTIDWRDHDSKLVFKRASEGVKSGDLILMHPTEHTLRALPQILEFYKEKGFKAVKVSQNIAEGVS